jgi:RNA polymerase sigma factor (sigma-70 family)
MDSEFREMTREEALNQEYKNCLYAFVGWFLIQFRPLLIKRCRLAANVCGLSTETWEDLLSDCCIEAYRVADRFDSSKGELKRFLIHSLWNFPFRDNNIKRYSTTHCREYAELDEIELRESSIESAYSEEKAKEKIKSLTKHLTLEEQCLLFYKFGMGMSNVAIGNCIGRQESTIRSRINVVLGKIKVSGTEMDIKD